jgi:transketolase
LEADTLDLRSISAQVRLDVLDSVSAAGSGHPGGSFSCVEILVQLYYRTMRIRPEEPLWPDRDRFVLSKGHACPALYSVLARRGFFDPAELASLRKLDSRLQGHPDARRLPGLDCSTGSLGQGFSAAVGLAAGLGLQGSGSRVYCLLGDGELQEGCVWESAATASQRHLCNIVAIVDSNGLQLDGPVSSIKSIEPLALRWQSHCWHAVEADGHDFGSLDAALTEVSSVARPAVVIARTIKGRGVSFMEGVADWHGRCPTPEEADRAAREIRERLQ